MKKIKGSLSAIRMSHLVVLFAVMAVSGLAIRTYQLLVMVNPTNGFFENANFTVPVLYGILAVGCVCAVSAIFLVALAEIGFATSMYRPTLRA